MRAIAVEAFETGADLMELPAPVPAASEVLVQVIGSSVNPVDSAIAHGMLRDMVEHRFPIVLGRDFAGVVAAIGADVATLAEGDQVFGFVKHADPAVHDGAWAELIAVSETAGIAQVPPLVDPAVAGAAPLAGITALAAIDALQISDGETVLIVGATGGVGSFAVQLAASAGATPIAPALPEDEDYLRNLGAAVIVPREGDVAAAVRDHAAAGVDALIDLVSYSPGAFDDALKPGARVVSSNGAAGDGPGRTNVMAIASRENVERVARRLADRTLNLHIQERYPFERTPEALYRLRTEHTRGKLAIRVAG